MVHHCGSSGTSSSGETWINGGKVRDTTVLVGTAAPVLQTGGPVGPTLCLQSRGSFMGTRAAPTACGKGAEETEKDPSQQIMAGE